jgi:hypothetical protein
MKMVRLNRAANDLLPQPTKHSYDNKILRHAGHIYFLVCNSCLWCATYFGINDLESLSASPTHALSCQICNSCNTKLMPISADVSSRMEYSITSGMQMEFNKMKEAL